MNTIASIDYYVLLFYILLILGIGIYFSKFIKGAKEYFTGGNMIPWWVGGISLYMSSFSAWTFTGASGFVYFTGLYGIVYFLTWSIAFFIGYRITAARWRRSRVISPVEYSSTRYNVTTQQFVGYVMVLSGILTRGITLTAVSKVVASTMGFNLDGIIIISGTVILLYTLLGGLWAVTITDVVQFIILLVITMIVMPMSIKAVGGISIFMEKIPPLQLEHVYSSMKYDIHYLFAITLVNIITANWGAAQRYFSVKDEKSARRLGLTCSLLFLTVPILFGIPPLAASILWPDLSVVEFFKGNFKPEDLVYVGMVLKVIPNGLIGIFLAAMFAATMSAIDTTFNIDSSIISRDLYGGLINTKATDKQIFLVGKISTVVLGIVTIVTAIIYAKSELGIFNLMVVFISLFFMPVGIPMAFGLVFKYLPRWSALSAISLGLLISALAKFLLGWTVGPHIYATTIVTFIVLILSETLGKVYRKNRNMVASFIAFWTILQFLLFYTTSTKPMIGVNLFILIVAALIFGVSLFLFSKLFSKEKAADRLIVEKFFEKLATPVNVAREVYGGGRTPISTYPVVGIIIIIIGLIILLMTVTSIPPPDRLVTIGTGGLLLLFGFLMFYFGSKSEQNFNRSLEEELNKL